MIAGIDIGGTSTKFGFLSSPGNLTDEKIVSTKQNYLEAINDICGVLSNKDNIESIGIGIPGIIDFQKGQIIKSVSLPNWSGKEIAQDISKIVKIPVKINNDAVCAAIAEANTGFGAEVNRLIYIIWGTGIGGTVIEKIDGKLHVLPIEPGYQILEWNGASFMGGHKGSLSSYAAGGEILNTYGKSPDQIDEDDPIWDQVCQKMAQGLINTLVHHPSKLIIFGGGMINKQPHLLEKIRVKMKEQFSLFELPELLISKHGEKGGILGAAILPSLNLI